METVERKSTEIEIDISDVRLQGILTLPDSVSGLVIFAHGSGSSRFSTRNRFVAKDLNNAGLGTLLFDLLTEQENETDQYTREYRFDIPMLANRLIGTIDWLTRHPDTSSLKFGLYGASTGAAAALIAAAKRPQNVYAVVSRGGRPDLAASSLTSVKAPTLLLIGGFDHEVIQLNELAAVQMLNHPKITIIPGATHLFEEPGKLTEVTQHALSWFKTYLH
ncbi:MAG: dienelactone hydrolase family protein [Gammaproteobacteria bacterium]|nr:dienelactone hydrolase family protein [Gammaproteobacteria bacterium]